MAKKMIAVWYVLAANNVKLCRESRKVFPFWKDFFVIHPSKKQLDDQLHKINHPERWMIDLKKLEHAIYTF